MAGKRKEFAEVARAVVHDTAGVEPKQIAIGMGLPSQRLYEATLEDSRQRRVFRPEWIPAVTRETRNYAMLHWLAEETGGVYLPPLEASGSFADLTASVSKVIAESADVLNAAGAAIADNRVEASEKAHLIQQLTELVSAAQRAITTVRQLPDDSGAAPSLPVLAAKGGRR